MSRLADNVVMRVVESWSKKPAGKINDTVRFIRTSYRTIPNGQDASIIDNQRRVDSIALFGCEHDAIVENEINRFGRRGPTACRQRKQDEQADFDLFFRDNVSGQVAYSVIGLTEDIAITLC